MNRRALLLLLMPADLLAQTSKQQSAPIYRCGNQLSDRPCAADAPASAVRFDEPSRADRESAQQRNEREAREARRLQKERERLERRPAPPPQRLSAPPGSALPDKQPEAGKPKSDKKKRTKKSDQRKGSGKASP